MLLCGCSEEQNRFPVVITTLTDEGKPFPSVPVTVGKALAGQTDAQGHLQMRVVGKEGAKFPVTVTVPQGFKLEAPAGPLVLRRLTDIEGGGGRILPIEYTLKLAPTQRQYAVLVRVGVAGLPVSTFGTQQGPTNSKGVAMFLYQGAPGDELQVRVSTADHPDLKPQNPMASFVLGQKNEAYVMRQNFTTSKPPAAKKKVKPVHAGPKRL
jgi:hypothetical protein